MGTGKVVAVCIGKSRGKGKESAPEILLVPDHGVQGDAHAGPGPRQVTLLDRESVISSGIDAKPGDFAENVLVEGIDFSTVVPGHRIRLGDTELEVTGVGKPEWKPGDYNFKGVALLAKRGLFARVIKGGVVNAGNPVELVKDEN